MARVWRAWDPKLEREVAIKEPLFDGRLTSDVIGEMSARFVKEGMAAARLNHPGIVTIFAAEVFDGRPVIIMELIDGVTLSEVLRAGALSPRVTLDILDQLLDAAGYAHSQGVVHRDIKPDNIFITRDGRVKLSDFGIARIEDGSQTKATQFGTVLGTPGYMAPEQATGSPVDNRTDLFAIGTIAYEMLTGNNPFDTGYDTNTASLLYKIVHEPVPSLPGTASAGLPSDIRPAILAALSKNPLERPQDAASYKALLHGAPAPVTSTIYEHPLPGSPKSTNSRKLLPYILVGGVGVIAIILVFLFAIPATSGGGILASDASQATLGSSGTVADTITILGQPGVAVGDIIYLGEVTFNAYHGGVFSDDIGWRVLAIEDSRVLVISEDIIELCPYHNEGVDITWEQSGLRRWLNGDFYNGLPADVNSQVQEVTNQNPDTDNTPGGNPTQDKVFLLSIDEANRYFSSDRDRLAEIKLSDTTIQSIKDKYDIDIVENARLMAGYWWWLRTPGDDNSVNAAFICGGGDIHSDGTIVDNDNNGVRPAMWLNL